MEIYRHKIEKEPDYDSKIELHFLRHAETEPNYSGGDVSRLLTERGRLDARSKAEKENIEQSVSFGSPRARAQETAGFIMAGAEEDITGEESLEELKEKINKETKVGSRIAIDKRLDFPLSDDIEDPYIKELLSAANEGRFLKFIVEESDSLSEQLGKEGVSYTALAASVADLIVKYAKLAPRWNELVQNESKEYKPELKRFLGTHQGIQESFLAKIIELTDGLEMRERFMEALDNQGFEYTEGFDCEILYKNGNSEIHIKFEKKEDEDSNSFVFDKIVPIELIENIARQQKHS